MKGESRTSELYRYESETMINQSRETPSSLTDRIDRPKPSEMEAISYDSMSYCSRFEDCSAPKCPLDILINLRTEAEDDPKCEMAKPTRHKYWESMPESLKELLPFQGYLEKEFNRKVSARKRWVSLPESVKQERIAKLKESAKR